MTLWKGFLALTCVIWLGACGGPDTDSSTAASQVLIFAAASTYEALEQIRGDFEAETGVAVTPSYASSGTLAQQIRAGAGAGLFLSAHPAWVDALEEDGFVSERVEIFGNRLVIIVPVDSSTRLDAMSELTSESIQRVAMGDPDVVPVGMYAKEALQTLGLWDGVQRKIVPSSDVRSALFYVERGEVDAAIVYATDAAISEHVRIAATLDSSLAQPVRYSLALIRGEQEESPKRRFYEYLQSAAASHVFSDAGFDVELPAS